MMSPCIQKQLKYYTLAAEAAMEGLKPGKSRREILKAKVEAQRWYKMYQKYGGKQPLEWSQSSRSHIGNPRSSNI